MHFFIDSTQLPTQSASNMKFGPALGSEATRFNVTTQFDLPNEAKAFACVDGMMVVQQNDSSPSTLVNVIIKPLNTTRIKGITVKYYIYRGIKRSSFFTGTNINASGPTNTEAVATYWSNRARLDPTRPIDAPSLLDFGYGANTLPLTDPTNLNENRPIKDIFKGKAPAKAFLVKEGMWIGDFDNTTIGFEIELVSELKSISDLTLKLYRGPSIFLQSNNDGSWLDKRKKEAVAAYIDPAAFFGMHGVVGVSTTTYTDGVKGKPVPRNTPGSLYSALISKFANKNRVYLDIKNERGLSYNFYGNYGGGILGSEIIKINGEDAPYKPENWFWPIYFFETTTSGGSTKNKVVFNLRKNGNSHPILYIEDNNLTSPNDKNKIRFFKGDAVEDIGFWSKDITLYFPKNTGGSNIAYHIRVNYFVGDPIAKGDSQRLANEQYYDSAFCSIDLEDLGDPSVQNGHVQNTSAIFINAPYDEIVGTGNFQFASQSGAYWDTDKVLFYSKAIDKINGSGKKYLNTYIRRFSLKNSNYDAGLKNAFHVVCKRYDTAWGLVNILGLNNYLKDNTPQEKEDLMILGLTTAQVQALKNTPGLSSNHPRYLFLDRDHDGFLVDSSSEHHRYYRYSVKIQGLDSGGHPTIVTPNTAIRVYSRDNLCFCSDVFTAREVVSKGANRIEFRIYRAGGIYINDNIDLALLRKSIVTGENTVGPDISVAGDTSSVQRIYYQYYENATSEPVDICSFDVVMSNEMSRNPSKSQHLVKTIPSTYSTVLIEFSGGSGAQRSLQEDSSGNIITTTSESGNGSGYKNMKYLNQGKKAFMVHFVTALTTGNVVFNGTNNSLGITFSFSGTKRRYANPEFAAAVLGALIRNGRAITSTGFGFGDGTAYPSGEHVNGRAMDSSYFGSTGGTWANDVEFMKALDYFGICIFRIGQNRTTLQTNLGNENFSTATVIVDTDAFITNDPNPGSTLHDNHLHTAKVKLKNRV